MDEADSMTDTDRACDVVVVGGGLAGCFAALSAARTGKRVALVEHGTYLGREFTSCLRPWIGRDGWEDLASELRELLAIPDCGEADVDLSTLPVWAAVELPLFCGALKKKLLVLLPDAGVDVLFMCRAAGVALDGDGARGIVLANKHGLQLLNAPVIVDATAEGWLSAEPEDRATVRRYAVGYSGATVPAAPELTVAPTLGLEGDTVRFHAGAASICPVYAEFAVRSRSREEGESEARRLAVELTRYLILNVPEFSTASAFDVAAETVAEPAVAEARASMPQGLKRLDHGLPLTVTCRDLAELRDRSVALGTLCAEESARGIASDRDFSIRSGRTSIPSSAFKLAAFEDTKLGVSLTALVLTSADALPCRERCDVLVAGGGTAGANAALAALSKGAATVVLEANSDLGGTQTLGMVASYYHGYKGGHTELLEQRFRAFSQYLQPNGKALRRTSKLLFYDRSVADAGGRCLFSCTICGGLMDGGRVLGLVAADARGLFRVSAEVTVDATGDGDAAVFCGAETTFGNPRNGNVQDYSQWSKGRGRWGRISTHLDLDVIDQRCLSENQRGLRIAHQKGYDFDFASMLTVREGRHVTGDYTLDLVDILEGRTFGDGIAEAQTDWDPHGISSSWLGRLGFLPVHCDPFYVQIPYRCCLPRGLSGLLVSAKAISATTDAGCLCRMAADVQNLGWATGLAAAAAVRLHGDVRAVDVAALRRELVQLGVLRNDEPTRAKVAGTPAERVRRLADGDQDALLDVAVLPPDIALPKLRSAFDSPDGDRVGIARALAWFGDASGAVLLREALAEVVFREPDRYDDTHPHKEGNPKAGIVDALDDYWRVNQLLVLLGLIADVAAVPEVTDVIERTWAGGEPVREANPYIAGRIDMQRTPHFDRLLCIAFCAERLAAPDLITPMEFLLGREWVGGYLTRSDTAAAGPAYHGAYAEVSLAAAAARCGSRKGVERLIDFLEDLHEILSAFAQAELKAVGRIDFGRDVGAWRDWLATAWRSASVPLKATCHVF